MGCDTCNLKHSDGDERWCREFETIPVVCYLENETTEIPTPSGQTEFDLLGAINSAIDAVRHLQYSAQSDEDIAENREYFKGKGDAYGVCAELLTGLMKRT